MKRLVIVTDSAMITAENRNAITAFLEGKGWSIWHWFQDLWLVDNVPTATNIQELRDAILSALPGPHTSKRIMVLNADASGDYGGMVPTDSIPWINEHWRRR